MSVQVKHVTKSATGQWWVINTSPASGSPTIYTVMEGTNAEAENYPGGGGVSGPYSSQAAADKVANGMPQNSNQPNPFIPGTSVTPGGQVTGGGPLAGLASVANFFGQLGQANTWIRVGEVLLGLVLLAVGVARITHTIPAATKIAKTAGAVL